MQANDVVQQGARGGLATFKLPEIFENCAQMRAPNASDGCVLFRHGHDAAGGASDKRAVAAHAFRIAGEGTEFCKGSGIGVDHARADATILGEAKLLCGLGRQGAKISANRSGFFR
jgi:hypothetical protein